MKNPKRNSDAVMLAVYIYIHVLFPPTKQYNDLSKIFNIKHLVIQPLIPYSEPVLLLTCEHGALMFML